MTKKKAPIIGLSSGQAATRFKKRPKVDRPADAVISETARAPTKDTVESRAGYCCKTINHTRPAPCGGPEHIYAEHWAKKPSK